METVNDFIGIGGEMPEIKEAPYRIIFKNPGLVDMMAVKTFGINAKENDHPIGFFGTGLKYAIAIILREGGKFTIWRGIERFDFTAREIEVRGKPFNVVYCNDELLSFTTDLGKNWKPWMALRELYCNTVDEKGEVIVQEREPIPEPDQTTMCITGETFGKVWAEERGAFILGTTPIATSEHVDVHPGKSHHLYYNGIRAYTSEKPFMFTYNIKTWLMLTEDRTIAWIWQAQDQMYKGLLALNNKDVLYRLFHNPSKGEEYAEYGFKYPEDYKPSPEALAVIKQLTEEKKVMAHGLGWYGERATLEQMEGHAVVLTDVELMNLADARNLLLDFGLELGDIPIIVTDLLAGTEGYRIVEGKYYGGVRKAFLSRKLVMEGAFQVAIALMAVLEEVEPYTTSKDSKRRERMVRLMLTIKDMDPDFRMSLSLEEMKSEEGGDVESQF